ncbi:hypothetical protein BDW62DRAFT_184624 [Aspergillus aurantiobrunneus]
MTFSSGTKRFRNNMVKSPDVDTKLQTSSSHLYHIYHTEFKHDYQVSGADKKPVYFVRHTSPLNPFSTDSLELHTGKDRKAPVSGICKFPTLSHSCKIRLGDPQHPGAMVWEDMNFKYFSTTQCRWSMSVPRANGGFERRWFLWRTQSLGADGDSPSFFSFSNFKLLDERNEGVMAVFTSSCLKSFRENGRIQVADKYGPDFAVMTIMTLLAMLEVLHRRRSSGSGVGSC